MGWGVRGRNEAWMVRKSWKFSSRACLYIRWERLVRAARILICSLSSKMARWMLPWTQLYRRRRQGWTRQVWSQHTPSLCYSWKSRTSATSLSCPSPLSSFEIQCLPTSYQDHLHCQARPWGYLWARSTASGTCDYCSPRWYAQTMTKEDIQSERCCQHSAAGLSSSRWPLPRWGIPTLDCLSRIHYYRANCRSWVT